MLGVATAQRCRLAAGLELFQGILTDRLQHPEAQLAVPGSPSRRTRLLATSDSRPSRLSTSPSSRSAHGVGGFQRPAADEDGEAAEEAALGLVQQVVAPGDRVAQRLLTGRQVACAAGQEGKSSLQPADDRLGREQADPGGRQLDRQRQAVQPDADLGDRGGVLVGEREVRPDASRARSRNSATAGVLGDRSRRRQSAARSGQGQRRDGVLVLAAQAERLAAGDQDLRPGRAPLAARRRPEAAGRICSKLSRTSSSDLTREIVLEPSQRGAARRHRGRRGPWRWTSRPGPGRRWRRDRRRTHRAREPP